MMQYIKACFGLLGMFLELVLTHTEGIVLTVAFAATIALLIVSKRIRHLWPWIAQWLLEASVFAYTLFFLSQAQGIDHLLWLYIGFPAIVINIILVVISIFAYSSARR